MVADGPPLLAWAGDDMTGSIDVLEALSWGGLRAVLLLDEPDEATTARFPQAEAIGWASRTRDMTAQRLRREVTRLAEVMRATGAPILHYKICSTFDSTPEVGSIGAAIEAAQSVVDAPFVPVLPAAPRLHRWCCFGNLFARSGWDSDVYRLDRHPTMCTHPVTPMHEADLRVILAAQTDWPTGLLDLVELHAGVRRASQRVRELVANGQRIVICDAVDDATMAVLGELLWAHASGEQPLLAVASSGVEHALIAHWHASGMIATRATPRPLDEADIVFAVSGSRSPVTLEQIRSAVARGWAALALDGAAGADPDRRDAELRRVVLEARSALDDGRSVVVHTLGDVGTTPAPLAPLDEAGRRRLGETLGVIAANVVAATDVRRVAVAGGDSSGHILRSMGATALEVIAPFAPAMPFCRAHGDDARLGTLELISKGGQTGTVDFFDDVRRGRPFTTQRDEELNV